MTELEVLCEAHGLTMTSDAGKYAIHFPTRGELSLGFLEGFAPVLADLLSGVLMDSATATESGTFENWCRNVGYSTEDAESKRLWDTVVRMSTEASTWLGPHFDTFSSASH